MPAPRRVEATHSRVLALALPMTLSHATTPLVGFVDTATIGRLGDAVLIGGIAIGAVLFNILFWVFGALRMATAGLTAQDWGAGDDAAVDATLARSLLIAAAIGTGLVVLQWPLGRITVSLMGGGAEVTQAALAYFGVRIWSAPFTLTNYAILGSVIGRGRTDLGLMLQAGINLVNVALTITLVTGLGLGIEGAAAGTVAAEAFGTATGALVLRRLGSRPFAVASGTLMNRAAIARMLAVNRDVTIRTAAILTAFSFFTAQGARAGDMVLATNAVLLQITMIASFMLDGLATAGEQLAGQATGSREGKAFRRANALVLGWSGAFGIGFGILALAGGDAFIDLVTTNPEVRASAREHLVFAALVPALGAIAYAYDGIYIGATWTRWMRDLMLAAVAIYFIAFLALRPFGNTGLWIALLIFLAARGIGQALAYPRLARRSFPDPDTC
jgi:MATE family multidrug resistance protein